MGTLDEFRREIDVIDDQLIDLMAKRLKICRAVGHHKSATGLRTMQPDRVRVVLDRTARRGEECGLRQEFVRALWQTIIDEACRLEDADHEETPAGSRQKKQPGLDHAPPSALDDAAVQIDHIAIAVHDIEEAIASYRDALGFRVVQRQEIEGSFSAMRIAVMQAGGVKFVLCQGTHPQSNVSQYIRHYGAGVQHVALEVRRLTSVKADLTARGFSLLSDIVHSDGLDQIFSRRDPNSGIQMEFVERNGQSGFTRQNTTELFRTMEREGVF